MNEPAPEFQSLPSDLNAELALIGAVISQNEVMNYLGFLPVEAFYSAGHADIFRAIEECHKTGASITPFTIKPRLEKPQRFEEHGGINKYLGSAIIAGGWEPRPAEVGKYLLDLYQKRQLILTCDYVSAEARLDHRPQTAADLAMELAKAVDRATVSSPMFEFEDNYAVSKGILDDLNDKRRPFSTGLDKLDAAMDGGLYPGKAYGFAARKKVGKTTLAATISANLNHAGVKHLFICGEMSPKEIQQRVLSRMTDIYASAFRSDFSKRPQTQMKIAEYAINAPRNTLYKNAPGLTFDQLRRIATVGVERYGIKGFILDYWQLVGGKAKGQSTAEHLDEVAQWIADFGRKRGIWTISMAQINQEGNTRGGEGIRLAFDQVYELHRQNLTEPDAWLEMMETRYTAWANVGSKELPGLVMHEKGPYFAIA